MLKVGAELRAQIHVTFGPSACSLAFDWMSLPTFANNYIQIKPLVIYLSLWLDFLVESSVF